jgi:putative tryptophan/tyrosine transport system ATP-binding protein
MIELRRIDATFTQPSGDRAHALREVTLLVPEGQFVAIIGTNGSGKSTLLNAVAGSFFPDRGEIFVGGRDITSWPEHRRAALVGRVFQDPARGTCPGLSVAENLRLAELRGHARWPVRGLGKRQREHYRERLARFGLGLERRLHALVGTLSGGQRQALTLLMATLQRPAVLLLDEHTAALDPRAAGLVAAATTELVREQRLTTLMVTHSMAQALEFGDRTVMMHQGHIVDDRSGPARQQTTPADLLDRFAELRDLLATGEWTIEMAAVLPRAAPPQPPHA